MEYDKSPAKRVYVIDARTGLPHPDYGVMYSPSTCLTLSQAAIAREKRQAADTEAREHSRVISLHKKQRQRQREQFCIFMQTILGCCLFAVLAFALILLG